MHVRFIKVPPTALKTLSGRSITVCHGDIYNVSLIEECPDGTLDLVFTGPPHDGEVVQGIDPEFLELSHKPTPKAPINESTDDNS